MYHIGAGVRRTFGSWCRVWVLGLGPLYWRNKRKRSYMIVFRWVDYYCNINYVVIDLKLDESIYSNSQFRICYNGSLLFSLMYLLSTRLRYIWFSSVIDICESAAKTI